MEISLIILSSGLTTGGSESSFGVYNSYFRLKYLLSLLTTGLYKVKNSLIIHLFYSLAGWVLTVCFLPLSVWLLDLVCIISTLLQVRLIHFCMVFLCRHKQNKAIGNIFMFSYPMSLWCYLSFLQVSWNQKDRCLSQWVWTDLLTPIRKVDLEASV